MNLPRYSRGFTLLELLISISVIGILTAGIVPSFNSYIKNQNLKQAQEQIKSDLRSIQNRALTGSLSDKLVNGNSAQYWGVIFTDSSASYTYFVSSDNLSSTCVNPTPSTRLDQGTFRIPNNILYSGSAVYRCLFFSIKNGNINKIPSGSSDYITLKYSDGSSYKRVWFNPSGLIYTFDE